MTNYNDGKWHDWNGGECPVHPKSEVIVKWACNGVETNEMPARCMDGHWAGSAICAFRVIKEHKEPITGVMIDCRVDARCGSGRSIIAETTITICHNTGEVIDLHHLIGKEIEIKEIVK